MRGERSVSVQLVNGEITKFLSTAEAGVLCIRGKWGVGKTYTWDRALEEAQRAKKVGVHRYSYVSLFGVDSIEDLKSAVFENVVTLGSGVRKADLNTLDEFISSNIGPWRKLARLFQQSGLVRSYAGGAAGALSFLTIRNQIVCIDDVERRGKGLDIGDVLGLTSFLREQRSCKIALILNDERLDPEQKQRFEGYLEKVVDVSLLFQPTPSE